MTFKQRYFTNTHFNNKFCKSFFLDLIVGMAKTDESDFHSEDKFKLYSVEEKDNTIAIIMKGKVNVFLKTNKNSSDFTLNHHYFPTIAVCKYKKPIAKSYYLYKESSIRKWLTPAKTKLNQSENTNINCSSMTYKNEKLERRKEKEIG